MATIIEAPTRILFFTGKGGVGKTSTACATAIALADSGKRVLLVSTDPASNLDEVLGVHLCSEAERIPSVSGLAALNIDPEQAAANYRERVVAPYRGVLPESAVTSMEEQLSGACTVEIAAFDEFSKLLGEPNVTAAYDHIIFDTAPTGHTLRLLALPAAWSDFIDTNVGGTSCLGPLSGLGAQRSLYAASNKALRDAEKTTVILVARPERSALTEAERTRDELAQIGLVNVRLIMNGLFFARDLNDPVAVAMEARGRQALNQMPIGLRRLERTDIQLFSFGLVGIPSLRRMARHADDEQDSTLHDPIQDPIMETINMPPANPTEFQALSQLVDQIASSKTGVVMTMGKGGVGKSRIAAQIARGLAERGFPVTLTTTDPAAHIEAAARELGEQHSLLRIERIDPELETRRYSAEVISHAGAALDSQGLALLEEDLRSPCTEEIAVFRAFAETVAQGDNRFVVIDTAPTGHTILLLDAAESYHREVLKRPTGSPEAVQRLLPRLRDDRFTHILLVTIPEATPIHEAAQLERDLARADIRPFAWIVNQALTPLILTDPLLVERQAHEAKYLSEVRETHARTVLVPWSASVEVPTPETVIV